MTSDSAGNNRFISNVPMYNAGRWIIPCLESIESQDYDNYSVLIIDDASTDGGDEQARRWVSGKPKCQLVSNEVNRGAVFNKTVGLQSANPEDEDIIVGLDGDDYLLSDTVLSRLDQAYRQDDLWITYGNFVSNDSAKPDYGRPINWGMPLRQQPFQYPALRTYK